MKSKFYKLNPHKFIWNLVVPVWFFTIIWYLMDIGFIYG